MVTDICIALKFCHHCTTVICSILCWELGPQHTFNMLLSDSCVSSWKDLAGFFQVSLLYKLNMTFHDPGLRSIFSIKPDKVLFIWVHIKNSKFLSGIANIFSFNNILNFLLDHHHCMGNFVNLETVQTFVGSIHKWDLGANYI